METNKNYTEFLERLNTLIDNAEKQGHIVARIEDIRNVFPELKESEDERIRKAIYIYLDWLDGRNKDCQPKGEYTIRDMLAWLKKQGMQKLNNKTAIESWKDMRLEVYQQASGNRHEPNYSDDSTKMFSLTDIDEIFEKIDEKQGKQEPTEWSEDDEKAIKDLINIVEAYYSLRVYTTREKELIDWLKSLRPQNRWKPSDKQMRALSKAIQKNDCQDVYLMALYNDLTKLIG